MHPAPRRAKRAARCVELPKTFDPAEIESRWYAHWEDKGLFAPRAPRRRALDARQSAAQCDGQPPYRSRARQYAAGRARPPRAVEGQGCALGGRHGPCRHRYADGWSSARWRSGRDKRANYSREQFVEKVWQWKAESGGAITGQLRRLGCSMDWANERFTMDEGFFGPRCSRCSSSSIARGCSIATKGW